MTSPAIQMDTANAAPHRGLPPGPRSAPIIQAMHLWLRPTTFLEECGRRGYDAVVVLGHPHYYPRFGFAPGSRLGLRCEFEAPDEAFMVQELRAGALGAGGGLVRYSSEFHRSVP